MNSRPAWATLYIPTVLKRNTKGGGESLALQFPRQSQALRSRGRGLSVTSRLTWLTKRVPREPGLHSESPSYLMQLKSGQSKEAVFGAGVLPWVPSEWSPLRTPYLTTSTHHALHVKVMGEAPESSHTNSAAKWLPPGPPGLVWGSQSHSRRTI